MSGITVAIRELDLHTAKNPAHANKIPTATTFMIFVFDFIISVQYKIASPCK